MNDGKPYGQTSVSALDDTPALNSTALTHFNAEDYRAALLCFEQHWHTERSDLLRALIQLCNALNQLRLGLVSGPRHNLASAAGLLAPLHRQGRRARHRRHPRVHCRVAGAVAHGVEQVTWADVPCLRLLDVISGTHTFPAVPCQVKER